MTKFAETFPGGHGNRRARRARSLAERRQLERATLQVIESGADMVSLRPLGSTGRRARASIFDLQTLGWVAIPAKGRAAWLRAMTLVKGEEARPAERAPAQNRPSAAAESAVDPAPACFSPGPRARALLRAKDMAARDLAESGGSYTMEEVRRLLNSVSRQSVEKRVREGSLLAVVGPNNKRFYPVAQFRDDGSVVEGLRAVQDALATRNGYAVLNFLVNPDPRLGDRRPIDLLKQGDVASVIEAAARTGEQGA
jgi:hypothetical protein